MIAAASHPVTSARESVPWSSPTHQVLRHFNRDVHAKVASARTRGAGGNHGNTWNVFTADDRKDVLSEVANDEFETGVVLPGY